MSIVWPRRPGPHKAALGLLVAWVHGCTPVRPTTTQPTPMPSSSNTARKLIVPPSIADVEAFCLASVHCEAGAQPARVFSGCVREISGLVLSSSISEIDPGWLRRCATWDCDAFQKCGPTIKLQGGMTSFSGTKCRDGDHCSFDALRRCRGGIITEVVDCASMGMLCERDSDERSGCVKPGCGAALLECRGGWLLRCDSMFDRTTVARCDGGGPCRGEGSDFSCEPGPPCVDGTCSSRGVSTACLGGVPRDVRCVAAGWVCPPPGKQVVCGFPAAGDACDETVPAACDGSAVRYCLNGHVRKVDCAFFGQEMGCLLDPKKGAVCTDGA